MFVWLFNYAFFFSVTTIPEASPTAEKKVDSISEMCKEISQGLSFLTNNSEDAFNFDSFKKPNLITSKNNSNFVDGMVFLKQII